MPDKRTCDASHSERGAAFTSPPHYHCPNDCENPQPFEHEGKRWCGRCWFREDEMVECILCTPETCHE